MLGASAENFISSDFFLTMFSFWSVIHLDIPVGGRKIIG
ncbi:MAG: hypothetical protein ACI8WB_000723 [Phenylobacterium sp.]|jgi:hypothetical protein